MAITDLIPRDQDAPADMHFIHAGKMFGYDPALTPNAQTPHIPGSQPVDPMALTVFLEHGPQIPNTDTVRLRTPTVVGGEHHSRNLNMVIPELTNPALNPAFAADLTSLPTPERTRVDRVIQRQGPIVTFVPLPDGTSLEVWPFQDLGTILNEGQANQQILPAAPLGWPSATQRARQGELVHTALSTRFNTHTIHNHAIEPTMMNDGPGHVSMEVGGGIYRYQWQAAEAGTYLYHCHKNTPLHFEMGMYGFLIVDPDVSGAPFADGGSGVVRYHNGLREYDREALWAVGSLDVSWRTNILARFGHSAGIRVPFYNTDGLGNPTGAELIPMHEYRPTVFHISGIPAPWTLPGNHPFGPDGAAVRVRRGEKILIRLLSAGYADQTYTFGVPLEVIGIDGRTLGFGEFMRYSRPFVVPAGKSFDLTVARRWDLFIDTATLARGTYPVHADFFHSTSRERLGGLDTQIIVE